MGEMRFEDNQPYRGFIIGDIRARGGTHVYPGKIASIALLNPQAFLNLFKHFLLIQLCGTVLGETCHAWLGGIPVALTIQVEVRRLVREAAQGITKGRHAFSWLHAAQVDLAFGHTLIEVARIRSRAEIDGTGDAPAGRVAAKVWVITVDAQRQRMRGIDIFL